MDIQSDIKLTDMFGLLFNNYVNEYKIQENMAAIKYYSGMTVSDMEINEKIINLESSVIFKNHIYRQDVMQEAYEPFLSWIYEIFHRYYDISAEEFLNNAGVYPLMIPMFRNYLELGKFGRLDQRIVSEGVYERSRLLEAIINILNYISLEHRLLAVIQKIHYAESSVLDLLLYMINHRLQNNIMVVITFNDTHKPAMHVLERYMDLIQMLKKNQLVIDCINENNLPETRELSIFTLEEEAINRYLVLISNMMDTLAYDQAEYYLELLYHKYEVEKYEIGDLERLEFLKIYGLTSVYNYNMKMAHIVCDRIAIMENFKENYAAGYIYNYISALAKVYSGQKDVAGGHVERCREFAGHLSGRLPWYFADVLFCFVWFDGWRDIFLWDEDISLPEEFYEKALEYEDYNLLSYIYFFGFVKGDMGRNTGVDESGLRGCEKSPYFKLGMKYADMVGNQEIKLRAWEKNVVVAARIGNFNDVIYYYNKCLELLEGQNRDIDMGMIYNGLGYNCITGERFEEAKNYFAKSIKIFYEKENPQLLCEALYNTAICAVVTKEYQSAKICMELILNIVERLGIERIRVCNISKVHGVIILSCLRLGQEHEAKLYFDKMRLVMRHLFETDHEPDYAYWDDDMFLYYLIDEIMKHNQNDLEGALRDFHGAKFHYVREKGNQFYVYNELIMETVEVMREMGEEDKACRLLEEAIQGLKKGMYEYQAKELEAYQRGLPFDGGKMGDVKEVIDFDGIRTMIWKLEMENDMKNMAKSLDFLETWVELLNRDCSSVETLIESAMLTMKNSYSIDELIYIEKTDSGANVRFQDSGMEFSPAQAEQTVAYFGKYPNKMVLTRFDRSFDKYEELVEIFGRNKVVSMVGVPLTYKGVPKHILIAIRTEHVHFTENLKRFTEEEMEIFRTTFRQLIDAINREEIKKKLEESSVTDILTGLLNRQGMKKKLEEEFDRMALEGRMAMRFTLIYMDLDNFKYCNDTFGHDIGDLVLIEFSNLMKHIVEHQGYIIRYGGDEFVIILPEQQLCSGILIIQNILRALRNNHGFKEAIENKLGRKILIKNQYEVSCSAGVSSEECFSYAGITELLKKADQALYKVKMSTKHDYEVWTN